MYMIWHFFNLLSLQIRSRSVNAFGRNFVKTDKPTDEVRTFDVKQLSLRVTIFKSI